MKRIIDWLIYRATPLKEIYGETTTYFNLFGIGLMAISFSIIGILFIKLAKIAAQEPGKSSRIFVTRLAGLGMLCAGIAMGLRFLAYWYNFANINMFFLITSGVSMSVLIAYVPTHIKKIKTNITLEEVKSQMIETSHKVDSLTELTKKLEEK